METCPRKFAGLSTRLADLIVDPALRAAPIGEPHEVMALWFPGAQDHHGTEDQDCQQEHGATGEVLATPCHLRNGVWTRVNADKSYASIDPKQFQSGVSIP